MELKDLIELAEKILGVPYYYTESEEVLSVGLSILGAAVGFFVVRRFITQTRSRIIIASGTAVVLFIGYYLMRDVGGVFWIQTACRILILIALTFIIPYSE